MVVKDWSVLQNVTTDSGFTKLPIRWILRGWGLFPWGWSGQDMKLITHPLNVP
jgi:hypothetical protein